MCFFFSSRRRHTRYWRAGVQTCALPISLFEQKNRTVIESSIDALFYNILASLIDSYEQLLTAIELSVTDFEQRTLYKPSRRMLEYLDSLSRQIIILRRHFWHMRDIINFLTHVEEDKEDVKYLKIVYDDINQLIEMIESYRDTINSTRELYVANVSLQMSRSEERRVGKEC